MARDQGPRRERDLTKDLDSAATKRCLMFDKRDYAFHRALSISHIHTHRNIIYVQGGSRRSDINAGSLL